MNEHGMRGHFLTLHTLHPITIGPKNEEFEVEKEIVKKSNAENGKEKKSFDIVKVRIQGSRTGMARMQMLSSVEGWKQPEIKWEKYETSLSMHDRNS